MRTAGIFLLIALASLAGCLGGTDGDDTDNNTPPTFSTGATVHRAGAEAVNVEDLLQVRAMEGASRYLPVSTFEPTVGADADGCLFYTHFQGTGTGTRIYRSCDQAETWEEKGPDLAPGVPCFPNSNDPYVYVDRDTGRVFSSDLHALVTSTLHFSDDKGETWTCNPLGGGLPLGVHDHQTVTTGVPRMLPTVDYPNIVYYCVNRVVDSVCSTSLDGGLGFGPLLLVYPGVENGQLCGGLHGHAATDPEGRVFLPKGQCGTPEVAVSSDDGLSWSRAVVSQTTGVQGHEVRVAADTDSNVYVFYMGSDGLPYLGVSTDNGGSWQEPWMVAPPGVTATDFPAVAAGGPGITTFAYIGTTHPDGYDAPAEELVWNAYIGIIYDALGEDPVIHTVQVNPEDDPIARGTCGRIRCGGLGDFIDMTVGPDGRPWAAFADMCHGECLETGATSNAGGTFGFVGTIRFGPNLLDMEPLPTLEPLAPPQVG